MERRGATFVLGLVITASAPHARAAEPVDVCIGQYGQYETHVAAGDFVAAKKDLARCATATCPGAIQKECVVAAQALEARMPTIVLVARDERRRDLTEVRVTIDGVLVRAQLDGRELELNPGKHVVRFEAKGAAPLEQTVVVREREKGRMIEAELPMLGAPVGAGTGTRPGADTRALAPSPAPIETPRSRSIPALTWVLGGFGVVAIGTSAVFGATALSARGEANDCKPNCSNDRVDEVNQRLLGADIALGVGVLSLAGALFAYWLQPTQSLSAGAAQR